MEVSSCPLGDPGVICRPVAGGSGLCTYHCQFQYAPKQLHNSLSSGKKLPGVPLRQKAFDMWLACHTQEEIADAIGYSRPHVTEFLQKGGFVGNGKGSVCDQNEDPAECVPDTSTDEESFGLGSIALT